MPERTRFAPSPTGPLHLGHAFAALFAHAHARRDGGVFLVRIEDIDAARCRPELTVAALADLDWLGLASDEPVLVQSGRLSRYASALARLDGEGLLYPCFCTRADIRREIGDADAAPHDPDGVPVYPGTCRALDRAQAAARIARGEPFARRLDVASAVRRLRAPLCYRLLDGTAVACRPQRFGDVVLGRKGMPASYHLASTVDDADTGVTLVTRAEDLAPATDLHRLLQTLFEWPAPRYAFHRILRGPTGRRLAKRDGAASLRSMREGGMTAAMVTAMLFDEGATR